jgi:hypothetical protein
VLQSCPATTVGWNSLEKITGRRWVRPAKKLKAYEYLNAKEHSRYEH